MKNIRGTTVDLTAPMLALARVASILEVRSVAVGCARMTIPFVSQATQVWMDPTFRTLAPTLSLSAALAHGVARGGAQWYRVTV